MTTIKKDAVVKLIKSDNTKNENSLVILSNEAGKKDIISSSKIPANKREDLDKYYLYILVRKQLEKGDLVADYNSPKTKIYVVEDTVPKGNVYKIEATNNPYYINYTEYNESDTFVGVPTVSEGFMKAYKYKFNTEKEINTCNITYKKYKEGIYLPVVKDNVITITKVKKHSKEHFLNSLKTFLSDFKIDIEEEKIEDWVNNNY